MMKTDIAKRLEWKFWDLKHDFGTGEWTANTCFDTFSIYDVSEKYPTDNRYYVRKLSDQFETLEQAQEACQARFDLDIKHSLSPEALALIEARTASPTGEEA